jgi:nuclear GTP-binding protein
VIEVLDARDPEGSRSKEHEKMIVEAGKKLVLLLNKSDLVSADNA